MEGNRVNLHNQPTQNVRDVTKTLFIYLPFHITLLHF